MLTIINQLLPASSQAFILTFNLKRYSGVTVSFNLMKYQHKTCLKRIAFFLNCCIQFYSQKYQASKLVIIKSHLFRRSAHTCNYLVQTVAKFSNSTLQEIHLIIANFVIPIDRNLLHSLFCFKCGVFNWTVYLRHHIELKSLFESKKKAF